MIFLSFRVVIIVHVKNTTREMEKLVLWTMLVSLGSTTVEGKNGATVLVMESFPVK